MKIVKKICFGLFVVLVLVYLIIIICPRIFTNFYPFGIKTAVVLTGSMSPTVEINDFVVMKRPDGVDVGDIVSYREDGSDAEVMHRIVKIDGDKIVTKGDSNNAEDKPIDASQITGVYIGKIEALGKVMSFITQPVVFSIIVVVLVILMLTPCRKSNISKKSEAKSNDKK